MMALETNASIKGLTQILLLVCVWGSARSQTCPESSAITPCRCNAKQREIICGGSEAVDLKAIFAKIHGGSPVAFNKLTLTNSAVQTLEDNVFGPVSFQTIEIMGASHLGRISKWALNASSLTLEEFSQKGENMMSDASAHDLFFALSTLTKVKRIFLDLTHVSEIPDMAFQPVNGRQKSLESIHLNYVGATYGGLKTVGDRAFYFLDNLNFISIANQPINRLKAHSFDFEVQSNTALEIHLEATQIRGNSFEQGVFLDAKRHLDIDMSNNQMDYLDEKVFKPVFDLPKPNDVRVNIQNNRLKCDCRMKWLVAGRQKYVMNLLEADCSDGDSIFEKGMDSYSNCP